jgi:hypothetical protein
MGSDSCVCTFTATSCSGHAFVSTRALVVLGCRFVGAVRCGACLHDAAYLPVYDLL